VPRGVHRTVPLRCESAVACAVLTSPPAPPPTYFGGDDGGGGGDDDSGSEFLRLITSCEQAVVLDDWVARSRIYKMTSRKDIRELHMAAIDEYEALRDYNTSEPGASGRRMLLGLFGEDDSLSALASAEVSHASGLVVSRLAMYPAELNAEDSTASLRMVHALHLLAEAIDTPLDLGDHEEEWELRLEEASGRAFDETGDMT